MIVRRRMAALCLVLTAASVAAAMSGGTWSDLPFVVPSAPVDPDPPPPVVLIRVGVPAVAPCADELAYCIRVENCSAAPAHHVMVRNAIPPNARYVRATPEPVSLDPEMTWPLGTLQPGACREITLVLAPTGAGDIKNCARVQYEHGQCVCTKITPSVAPGFLGPPALQLRKEGPSQAAINEVLSYRLTITNSGQALASGVVITDVLPAELEHESKKRTLTWDMGDLSPGQTRSVEYQVIARQPGRLCNGAVATAGGGIRQEVEHCVLIGDFKVALEKSGPKRRYLNMPAEYRLSVKNTGNLPLTNVVIADPVPPGLAYVNSTAGGQLQGTEVRWLIGGLEPGASRNVEVSLRAQQLGTIQNRALVTAAGNAKAEADATTEFFGAAALMLEVVDANDPVEVGGNTSYVIIVRNQGNVPATDVRLTAQVPDELEATRTTGPVDHKKTGQTLTFDTMTLQPHADARFVVYAQAKRPGDVRFKVELSAKDLSSGPIQEEESTTIFTDFQSRRTDDADTIRKTKK